MQNGGSHTVGVYALIIAAGLLGAVSDAVLNQWAKIGGAAWLLASYVAWIAVATVLGFLFRSKHLSFSTTVVVFLVTNVVFVLLLDSLAFKEKVTGWQWLGIGLAIAAVVAIEFGRAPSTLDK